MNQTIGWKNTKIAWVNVSVAFILLLLLPAVTQATTVGNSITVTNDATVNGNVTTTNATSSGYMDIGGKLANSNSSYTNGDLNVGNRLAIDGATYVSSTLDVTGNSRFYGTLTVDGAQTLTGLSTHAAGFLSSASSSIGSSLNVSGNLNASSTLFVGGNILPNANNTLDFGVFGRAFNEIFASGTAYLAGVSTTAGLYPTANNSYDLGGYALAWRNLFASTSLRVGGVGTEVLLDNNSLDSGGAFTLQTVGSGTDITIAPANTGVVIFNTGGGYVRPTLNNWEGLGAFGTAWNTFFVSGTAYLAGVSSTEGIYPTANNSVDIGGFGRAWNEIFASGTVRIGDTATLSQGSAAGDLNVGNNFVVDGTANVSSTLQVTGNVRFYGELRVDTMVSSTMVTSSRHIGIGQVDSSNASWAGGSLNVGNRLAVDGATFVSSTLDVTGNSRFYGTLTVDGNLTTSGDNTLGDNAVDIITINARLANDFVPQSNNLLRLGAFGNAYEMIFSSSTIRSATSTITNAGGTSTLFVKSEASGAKGGTIYLEDADGSGCLVLFGSNGVLTTESATCPADAN